MKKNYISNKKNLENRPLLHILGQGIDDTEADHELPLEDAFRKITELRDTRRNAYPVG